MIRFTDCAPSPACGGGLGWGQPTQHCILLASILLSPIPAFPRERGKEQTA